MLRYHHFCSTLALASALAACAPSETAEPEPETVEPTDTDCPATPVEASGAITADAVWRCDHLVTADVSIEDGAVLTIAPGVTVTMAEGATLYVGNGVDGGLVAKGSSAEPIAFEGVDDKRWATIFVGDHAIMAELEHVDLTDGAGEGPGWENASIYVDTQSEVSLADVTIAGAGGYGIYFYDGAAASRFDRVSLTDTDGIVVDAEPAGTLFPRADLGSGVIEIAGGDVTADTTWYNHGVPYHVLATVEVGAQQAPTLTVEAGAVLLFEEDTFLRVGQFEQGSLIADGSDGDILFDSLRTVPEQGDWIGVIAGPLTVEARFHKVQLSHAGGHYSSPGFGWGADAALIARSVTVAVTDTIFRANVKSMVLYDGADLSAFSGNVFDNPDVEVEIIVDAQAATTMSGSNTFAAEDRIEITGGTVEASGTWHNAGAPYRVREPVYVEGDAAPELTIAPGVTLEFHELAHLTIGADKQGALIADGTSEAITMRSARAVPGAGDWQAVAFLDESLPTSLFRGVTLQHCGDHYSGPSFGWGADACLILHATTVPIEHCAIGPSAWNGIEALDGGLPLLVGNTFTDIAGSDVQVW